MQADNPTDDGIADAAVWCVIGYHISPAESVAGVCFSHLNYDAETAFSVYVCLVFLRMYADCAGVRMEKPPVLLGSACSMERIWHHTAFPGAAGTGQDDTDTNGSIYGRSRSLRISVSDTAEKILL